MDREVIERYLAKAEAHVALGAEHIDKQERFVSELDPDDTNFAEARRFLNRLISTQVLDVAHRDKLLGELRALSTEGMTATPYSREHVASRAATRAIEQNDRASRVERQVWREEAHLRNENSWGVSEGVGGSTPRRRQGRAASARKQ